MAARCMPGVGSVGVIVTGCMMVTRWMHMGATIKFLVDCDYIGDCLQLTVTVTYMLVTVMQ